MDTAQWPQFSEIVAKPTSTSTGTNPQKSGGRQKEINNSNAKEGVNCPRCNSTNTKFCYYNNYSLTQPRYFCKTCRRYWTEGGTLRNIPVGGGSRKNKRPSSSSLSSSSSIPSKKLPGLVSSSNNYSAPLSSTTKTAAAPQNPKMVMEVGQDYQNQLVVPRSFTELMHHHHHQVQPTIAVDDGDHQVSSLELLNRSSGGISNFMNMPPQSDHEDHHRQAAGFDYTSSGLSFLHQDFKASSSSNSSSLSFSLDGGIGRPPLLFAFEDLKQVPPSTDSHDHHHPGNGKDNDGVAGAAADSSGYWTGMLGGGSW